MQSFRQLFQPFFFYCFFCGGKMTKNKETYYFSHDYNARNDQRILQLRFKFGWEGYGIYWALLETMAEDEIGDINREAIVGL